MKAFTKFGPRFPRHYYRAVYRCGLLSPPRGVLGNKRQKKKEGKSRSFFDLALHPVRVFVNVPQGTSSVKSAPLPRSTVDYFRVTFAGKVSDQKHSISVANIA